MVGYARHPNRPAKRASRSGSMLRGALLVMFCCRPPRKECKVRRKVVLWIAARRLGYRFKARDLLS